MKTILLAFSVFVSSLAMADQCAYVPAAQAKAALVQITKATTIEHFCQPCGNRVPEVITLQNLEIQSVNTSGSYSQVLINGKGIDLTYIYVDHKNLGDLVGCLPARD